MSKIQDAFRNREKAAAVLAGAERRKDRVQAGKARSSYYFWDDELARLVRKGLGL